MSDFIDAPAPVRSGEELDLAKLECWLKENVAGATGSASVEQFPQGFSNLTYFVKIGEVEMVLRRPPFGNRVRSAHDMGREYRVLSKLSMVYDLAPRPLAWCDDESVLGATFYVMERRRGVILRRKVPDDFDLPPSTLHTLGESFIDNLARLHDIDYQAAGLGDLGKPDGFVARQVAGWTKRYIQAQTDDIPEMLSVADWLDSHQPPQGEATLIHNDYKYDNLILDPHNLTRIIALLDWEMCTLGDPLLDLGCSLAYWVEADDDDSLKQFIAGPTNLPGSLTRHELMDRYAAKTGRDLSQMLFFYCFGLFKLAVIIQQIYYRYAKGHTSDRRFATMNTVVASLSKAATSAIGCNRVP